ncbi:Sporulation lipoprotein YhcN/YlaJ-like protein [Caldalkalibacillus thermarum TA2.A1]|uniref:Sporulation lipoprotein YhcN/YlaJ-like protein n=1 Tax=Caldalkalibacillus thermarum (strain TA2.A1) TaxID=986075 RepID=F5LAP8_CALTT|nr:YhcN/YlaJ family sporulation lipoprotein [Caldalkalibacillus thermarum]EGL81620.1 Sporulation lipoprotein YhcN/YlaJ-like protein [Caldalkalibacillus thermarum TA2.A1]
MKKLALGLTMALTISAAVACAPADDDMSSEGYRVPDRQEARQDVRGFDANRQDMWGGFTRNRQFGRYDDTGLRGLRQYHRYGERGMFERYGDPLGPRDRTLGYDWMRGDLRLRDRDGVTDIGGPTGVGRTDRFAHPDLRLAQRLADRCQNIQGVRKAEVIVYEDDVIVGVQPERGQNEQELESRVESVLRDQVRGKEIHIITDRDQFNRLGEINRALRDGQPFGNFARDIGDMIQGVGRAVTEPFRR